MFKLKGIYAALLTPLTKKGTINIKVLRKMLDFYIEKKLDGVFPNSSVGEFVTLSFDERKKLTEDIINYAGDRINVIPGTTAVNPKKTIELTKHAERISCQAVTICPPYYYPVNQEIIENFYDKIYDEVDKSIILYNIPFCTTEISYSIVKKFARYKRIIGMKDSSGNMIDFNQFLELSAEENFNVMVGCEEMFLPSLFMGGKGCMTATAGILPEVMLKIFEYYSSGEYKLAKKLQMKILPLLRAIKEVQFPSGFKIALKLRGFQMGPLQQPISEEKYCKIKTKIKKELEKILGNDIEKRS